VRDGAESAVGEALDIGSAAIGETVELRIRLRNQTTEAIRLSSLRLIEPGFRLEGAPRPPIDVAAGLDVNFRVQYTASTPFAASANLLINGRGIILYARGLPSLRIVADSGETLNAQSTVEFGSVERGNRASRRVRLENGTTERITVGRLEASGAAYSVIPPTLPLVLEAGQTHEVEIAFSPATSGLLTGALLVDARQIRLAGLGTEPKPPKPTLVLPGGVIGSGQQVTIGLNFSEPSRANAKATLRVQLAGTSRDDGVLFPVSGVAALELDIKEGDTAKQAVLQTGTLAGTLRVIADIAGYRDEATMEIAPAAPHLDSGRAVRDKKGLSVQVNGFDNTRTASQVLFTFYDAKGSPIEIRHDVSAIFTSFFGSSTFGGMFALQATFPVTGDATQIASVTVELTNAKGSARSERLRF
jgi:hypothetical protein